jgi:hypothetical protein
MALFTPEELEELRRVDEEIDADFRLTNEDLRSSRKLDREAQLEAMDPDKRKVAAQQKAYREANRDKYNSYMREYMKKRKLVKANAT